MDPFSWIAGAVAWFVGKESLALVMKVLRVIAYVAAIVALFAAMVVAVQALANTLLVSLPSDAIVIAGALMPTNTLECLTAVLTGIVYRFLFDWHAKIADKLST